jgi:hypothetical protein
MSSLLRKSQALTLEGEETSHVDHLGVDKAEIEAASTPGFPGVIDRYGHRQQIGEFPERNISITLTDSKAKRKPL